MVTTTQESEKNPRQSWNDTRTQSVVKQARRETASAAQPDERTARQIARGVCRYFRALNCAVLDELTLADGRRCDVMALDEKGGITIVEIKSCMADFRSDHKWTDYRNWCDRFYFAVLPDFPHDKIPADCGLILADRFDAEAIRQPPGNRLSAARRKALMLRFARCSAFRLQDAGCNEAHGPRAWPE